MAPFAAMVEASGVEEVLDAELVVLDAAEGVGVVGKTKEVVSVVGSPVSVLVVSSVILEVVKVVGAAVVVVVVVRLVVVVVVRLLVVESSRSPQPKAHEQQTSLPPLVKQPCLFNHHTSFNFGFWL